MIPKVVHISWVDKVKLFTSNNPIAINGIQNMKRLNPDYAFQVSDDNDIDDYIQSCMLIGCVISLLKILLMIKTSVFCLPTLKLTFHRILCLVTRGKVFIN